jgi:hypothetical protein
MSRRSGRVFMVGGRPVLDSRAVLGLAARHDLIPHRDGWDLALGGGQLQIRRVDRRASLPGVDGSLYTIEIGGRVPVTAMRAALSAVKLERAGTFEGWPEAAAPEVTACGAAGPACGCRACDHPHGEDEHDHDEVEEGLR